MWCCKALGSWPHPTLTQVLEKLRKSDRNLWVLMRNIPASHLSCPRDRSQQGDVLQGNWVIVTTLPLPNIAPRGFVHPIFRAQCPLSCCSAKVRPWVIFSAGSLCSSEVQSQPAKKGHLVGHGLRGAHQSWRTTILLRGAAPLCDFSETTLCPFACFDVLQMEPEFQNAWL